MKKNFKSIKSIQKIILDLILSFLIFKRICPKVVSLLSIIYVIAFHLIKAIIHFEELVNASSTLRVIVTNPTLKYNLDFSKFDSVY